MSAATDCDLSRGDAPAAYVSGSMPADEQETFEAHMLECRACQDAVREGAAIHGALRAPRRARSTILALGGLAAAAAALLLFARTDPVVALGRVGPDLPTFDGLPVRADPDSVSALIDRGMEAYSDRRHARAAELLGRVPPGARSQGVRFFLGVAHLAAGNPAGAVDALGTLVREAGPYRDEAIFYLAKAHLALGDAGAALTVLDGAGSGESTVARHVRALADSVRAVTRDRR